MYCLNMNLLKNIKIKVKEDSILKKKNINQAENSKKSKK